MAQKQPSPPPATEKFVKLPKKDRDLVTKALQASVNAYAPYSGFAVGAAVRARSGKVYTGANIENAAYAVVTCAEISAIACANSAGDFDIEAIAVSGHKFTEPRDSSQVVTPCGRCRQAINEAAAVAGRDIQVISGNGQLDCFVSAPISQLLPQAFGPKNLDISDRWPETKLKLRAALKGLLAKAKRT